MTFNKVIEDVCRYAPIREHNTLESTGHLGIEALVYLKQLIFHLGDYDSIVLYCIYYLSLDPHRITKSIDMEIVNYP